MLLTALIFFFNDTATTEIYTLSLHDALPISLRGMRKYSTERARAKELGGTMHTSPVNSTNDFRSKCFGSTTADSALRSEEHTSELQSQSNLVCRLLLEKKKKYTVRVQSDVLV